MNFDFADGALLIINVTVIHKILRMNWLPREEEILWDINELVSSIELRIAI
jgi:hypothetical protein